MNTSRFVSLLICITLAISFRAHASSEAAHQINGDESLALLMDGNARFVSGEVIRPHQTGTRRAELAKGQSPVAIVLTCSDSRVAPELYFDQGLGDLFVVRNAGNVVDDHVLGSIEYAVEHLHTPLIIVVGHEKCGAVSAAVAGGHAPGHIASIVESISPAVEAAKDQSGDKVDNTVCANARRCAQQVCDAPPFLTAALQSGKVKVVAARYELATGRVAILQ